MLLLLWALQIGSDIAGFGCCGFNYILCVHLCVNIDNGSQLQATLAEMTGQKTVPNVFISGQHVGKPAEFMCVITVFWAWKGGNELPLWVSPCAGKACI
jgi:hypothetical protein